MKRQLYLFVLSVGISWFVTGVASGQVVLFEDDFNDGEIDTSKWRIDEKPYETGAGDYEVVEADGVVTMSGTSTQNWWAGIALATIPTFSASADAPLTFEVERVMHEGTGSSTRTSIWITDVERSNFILFSYNSNEGGWTYNKKVGDGDDNPTGGGNNITQFDGKDGSTEEHLMGMEANGETVTLFLDEEPGPTVNFPFSEGIVFQIAVYAREGSGNQDTVSGVFDNVFVRGPAAQCISLTPPFTEALQGETPELTLQIPPDAARPATVTITSSAPDVATPSGAVDGVLTVTFAEGDASSRIIPVELPGVGLADFTVTSELPLCEDGPVRFSVPAVLLEDDFEDAALDETLWREDLDPFEDGDGAFDYVLEDGVIKLQGEAEEPLWPGIAIMTNGTFSPTPESPVRFAIDMTLMSTSAGTFRSGVWAASCDRDEYIFFSFLPNRNGGAVGDWNANSTTAAFGWPPTGEGNLIRGFECCGFEGMDITRRVELVADGRTLQLNMGGIDGPTIPFELDNISFGFGAYALGTDDAVVFDSVDAHFDNALITGQRATAGDMPCVDVPTGPLFVRGDSDDNGSTNITDAIGALNFLFGGAAEPACLEAADVDNDGTVNISDPIRLLGFLFGGAGAPPEPPVDTCGPDPAEPTQPCVYTNC